jgi:hypothetical protein
MSSTRHAPPGADPDDSNERYLASARLKGIAVGTNIVARVARVRTERERNAMLWLCGYARLRDLTADALTVELDMDRAEIRRALTDPEADLTRFVEKVEALRATFEDYLNATPEARDFKLIGQFDKALCELADTKVRRKIANACKMALEKAQIIEITGKTQQGKSIGARNEYLHNLHRAAWITAWGKTEKDWYQCLAEGLGVWLGNNTKTSDARPRILSCLGPNRINLLFIDEAHRLWPRDLTTEPSRIEFLRDLWELHGVSIIILATPQYSEMLSRAMNNNPQWAPGQWVGRVQTFPLADTMSEADLAAIALHHAPGARKDVVDQLVKGALSSEGYAGSMVKVIERAMFKARVESGDGEATMGLLTVDLVKEAQRALERDARVATIKGHVKLKQKGKLFSIEGEAA